MLATVPSLVLRGMEASPVQVEVAITRGTPMIQMVGLPESAVREGKERIRAAARAVGLGLPGLRITVNLAPAGVRKGGAALDLPILAGVLAAWGELPRERCRRWTMAGELGLDGSLRPVRGALPMVLHHRDRGDVEGLVLPRRNLPEARPVPGVRVVGARGLEEVLAFLRGETDLPGPGDVPAPRPPSREAVPDLADVVGQEAAKRALEVAAAGGHNLLFQGEPGSGKTMLARRLTGLLPPMSLAEAVDATALHSVAGKLPPGQGLLRERPFRSPHHTVSAAGLVGGGAVPRPGEASLAHRGVLFLDELPEFGRASLEALRQPMEEGYVRLVRARASLTYPARFQLVAAMNPCPCGFRTAGEHRCACDPAVTRAYVGRVSGPLLDRIDLHVSLSAVPWREIRRGVGREGSAPVRARVREARARAERRTDRGAPTADLCVREVRTHCRLDPTGEGLLADAVDGGKLSVRGCHRVLRVARTVADLAGSDRIASHHLTEAIRFRPGGDDEEEDGEG